MGRSREFEDGIALEKAMKIFWEKGYAQTTMKDLLEGMNILNGSFYNTFGNKKNAFLKSLELYYSDLSARRLKLFESKHSFSRKLRETFNYSLDRPKKIDCPKGCLLVNSLSSDALDDSDIRSFLQSCYQDFEEFLTKQIIKAKESGEVNTNLDPKILALILNTHMQGQLKLCTLDYSDERLKEQTEVFLQALGL